MAEAFDKQLAHANVYAEALFALAREAGQVDEVRQELEELSKLLHMDESFLAFAESSALDDDVREMLLEGLFAATRVNDEVRSCYRTSLW